jgi:hypothetical protein
MEEVSDDNRINARSRITNEIVAAIAAIGISHPITEVRTA